MYDQHKYVDTFAWLISNLLLTYTRKKKHLLEVWLFLYGFAAEFTVFCAEWLLMVGMGTLETGKVAGTM